MNTNESHDNTTTDIQQPTEQNRGLTDLEPNSEVKGGGQERASNLTSSGEPGGLPGLAPGTYWVREVVPVG